MGSDVVDDEDGSELLHHAGKLRGRIMAIGKWNGRRFAELAEIRDQMRCDRCSRVPRRHPPTASCCRGGARTGNGRSSRMSSATHPTSSPKRRARCWRVTLTSAATRSISQRPALRMIFGTAASTRGSVSRRSRTRSCSNDAADNSIRLFTSRKGTRRSVSSGSGPPHKPPSPLAAAFPSRKRPLPRAFAPPTLARQ